MPRFATASGDPDLIQFDADIRQALNHEEPLEYAVEPSIQGITVEMVYEKGTLAVASTRGNGVEGEDITPNIKTILTVPLRLERLTDASPVPELLVIWGRVYMEKDPLDALNRSRRTNQLAPYADSAEAAADSLLQTNPKVTAKRPLNVFCVGACGMDPANSFETHYDRMVTVQQWGIRVNRPYLCVCNGIEQVIEHCRHIQESMHDQPYPVDGATVHVNRLSYQRRLGETSYTARWAITYNLF
jgi:DNA ligase (NAD+)